MAHRYVGVQWNGFKLAYDLFLLMFMAVFVTVFWLTSPMSQADGSTIHPVQQAIRATGSLGFVMLTAVLMIGPLARLTPRALPLLYNRRHFGVLTFMTVLVHAALVVFWYHGFSETNPIVSLFLSNPRYDDFTGFPFEALGAGALVILFLMAVTSHDFWNAHLGPVAWKMLHMGVYAAYGLVIAHVALGALQVSANPVAPALIFTSLALVGGLHMAASLKRPPQLVEAERGEWLRVGRVSSIPEGNARIVRPPIGDAIAVFRSQGVVQGVSHVCPHQAGPLGEGRIVDGCVTCPWHGHQFQLMDGRAPGPYTDRIATYQTRVEDGDVFVRNRPNPPDEPASPSMVNARSETP